MHACVMTFLPPHGLVASHILFELSVIQRPRLHALIERTHHNLARVDVTLHRLARVSPDAFVTFVVDWVHGHYTALLRDLVLLFECEQRTYPDDLLSLLIDVDGEELIWPLVAIARFLPSAA